MSWVTNIILHIPAVDARGPQGRIKDVNRFFDEIPGKGFVSLDDPSLPKGWYGGSKLLEANLYVGALNHLDLDSFVKHLQSIDWKEPNHVQVIVMDQEDLDFRIIRIIEDSEEVQPGMDVRSVG